MNLNVKIKVKNYSNKRLPEITVIQLSYVCCYRAKNYLKNLYIF